MLKNYKIHSYKWVATSVVFFLVFSFTSLQTLNSKSSNHILKTSSVQNIEVRPNYVELPKSIVNDIRVPMAPSTTTGTLETSFYPMAPITTSPTYSFQSEKSSVDAKYVMDWVSTMFDKAIQLFTLIFSMYSLYKGVGKKIETVKEPAFVD